MSEPQTAPKAPTPAAKPAPANKPVPASTPAPANKWYDSVVLTIALLIFLWPVGIFALFKNRRLGGFGKFVIGGGITFCWLLISGGAAFGGYWLYTHPDLVEKYVPGFKSSDPTPKAVTDKLETAQESTIKSDAADLSHKDISSSGDSKPAETPKPPDAPKADAVKTDEARAPDAQPAKPFEDAKANVALEQAARALADREAAARDRAKAELAEKSKAAAEEKDNGELERKKQEEAARADAAAALRKQADAFIAKKKSQVGEWEKALADFNTATQIQPHLQNMEESFLHYLKDQYKSADFNDEKFNAYFTEDYLRNYNQQIAKQQQGIREYIKILRGGIAKTDQALAKLITDSAGGPTIDWPPPDPALDKHVADLIATTDALKERVVTLADLREKMGVRPSARIVPPPNSDKNVASNELDPFGPRKPLTPRDPPIQPVQPAQPNSPLQPIAPPPPVQPIQPIQPVPPPVAPPAVATSDIAGNWVRHDGKVVWFLETTGILIVRDKKPIRGTWTFDEATSTLTVQHSGVPQKFTVTKENNQFFMLGGASGATPLRFNKK